LTKILIADRDREFRELLIFSLRFAGYFTFGAADGAECLAMVKQHWPDLILLDQLLLENDSFDLYSALHDSELTENIPVVCMMTTQQMENSAPSNLGYIRGSVDKSGTPDQITKAVLHYVPMAKKPNP
jgi:CheY-like chemotaxis protein